MLPTRFASVRYKKRRPAVRIASFRDDTSLVALRYDKTVAAEPPIPIPARNPLRPTRPRTSSSSSSSSHHRPIIVAPPHPLVAPPTEEHPALRTPPPPRASAVDEWKRDSGHAPRTSSPSSMTILEEDGEDEDFHAKVEELAAAAVRHVEGQPELNQRAPSPALEDEASLYSDHSRTSSDTAVAAGHESSMTTRPPRRAHASSSAASSAYSPPVSMSPSPSAAAQDDTTSLPQQRPHSPRRLAKTFSLRSVSLMRTKSPTPSCYEASDPATALMRGPSPPPATAPSAGAAKPSMATSSTSRFWTRSRSPSSASSTISDIADFSPLAIAIPTDSFLDDDFVTSLSFSKRGSILLGGERAMASDGAMEGQGSSINDDDNAFKATSGPAPEDATVTTTPMNTLDSEPKPASQLATESSTTVNATVSSRDIARELMPPPDIRILAVDVEKESQKVRSLYSVGDAIRWEDGAGHSHSERLEPTPEAPSDEGEEKELDEVPSLTHLNPTWGTPRSGSSYSHRTDNTKDSEAAGGLEDWDDLDGAVVDRYGFITAPRPGSSRLGTPTEMKSVQFSPRRRNVLQKRDPVGIPSPLGARRMPSRKVSARSLKTQNSEMSTTSLRSSRSVIRQAGNLLPHNRDRRWMDEAGDMLAVSPSLQDIAEEMKIEKMSEALKRKEWERSEKWRKMAKVVKKDTQGQGMDFEFDTKNPKLIERTWKGIPDRWRAAAWWSFMATSAKNHKGSPTEEEIVADFHKLQRRGSPDDVQIDLDVPRTIGRHIMFRRRYRGGQRLLFRVLHAISIYYPVTGYVQGMASLAATLLCYFDEEKCFVMLVRMWQLRGLDRLYRPGFENLMSTLREFETSWLNKDVANKLTELCVDSTAYGTRWYLTLFNLSIPFPAQLRVWDVFLLLGDGPLDSAPLPGQPSNVGADSKSNSPSGLDILHATSAALIQALREVLLDSDFENVMKALTSWIQIKDEDLLMKVTKAEWKAHQGKRKS